MSSSQTPPEKSDFFAVAAEFDWLTAEAAQQLTQQATADGVHPSQLALRKGLLDAVQIDIVETLLHPEETVPDFEILGVLGQGGMGVVYRARQKSLDRVVALKTVLVSRMSDPSLIARFEREAMTVAKLQHPNIVAAYDFGRHEGRLYLAMEFVDGKDVEKLIRKKGAIDEVSALGLVRQAAAGLSHAASLGIVHRDIKPANLLLVEPPAGFALPSGLPMVKIADFGLAILATEQQVETRLTAANTTVGSPHYMAPEQIAGETTDHRADCYSLGATLYHMLTGAPPFDAPTLPQIIALKLKGDYRPVRDVLPHLSEPVAQLVDDMLILEPDDRPADYDAVITRIDAILTDVSGTIAFETPGGPAVPAQSVTLTGMASTAPTVTIESQSATKPRDRKRLGVVATVLAVALLGAVVAVSKLFTASDDNPPSRTMMPSGWSQPLFNGKSLGALPVSGSWVVGKDDEGGLVIEGSNGMIRHPLFRPGSTGPQPLQNYRLTLFVRLHKASAVELHFGISAENSGNGPRSVLRVTEKAVQLAQRSSDRGELSDVSASASSLAGTERYHVIVLDRQGGHCWVEFDDRLIGNVMTTADQQLPEIRLAVEEGPAWFSDLHVDELRLPDQKTP